MEIFDRELNGMLLFSLLAAQNGWQVLLGGKKSLFPLLGDLPQGIVVLKSVVPGEVEIQDKIRGYGHKVTSIDAEGLLPSNGKSGVELRYSSETISKSDKLFFWGPAQYDQVKEYFPSISNIGAVTGSPIFDYWRLHKFSRHSVSNQDQKTILIATSFPFANHVIDPEQAYDAVRVASGKQASEEHLQEIFLGGALQEHVYPKFIEMVHTISKTLIDYKVILRPHPAESPTIWSEIAALYDNVELQYGGEISKWLLECDYFIHFNSTTSIEARYYDKQVITLVPELKGELADRLNEFALLASTVCRTSRDVLEAITESADPASENSRLDLNGIIAGADSDDIALSSSNIVHHLEDLGPPDAVDRIMPSKISLFFSLSTFKSMLKLRIIWLLGWIDYFTKVFNDRYAAMRHFYKYGKTKQGKLKANHLSTKVGMFADALKLQRDMFRIGKIKNGLFLIRTRS